MRHKLSEDELSNFIIKNNLCHFKKVNLLGASNVGKKTLLSYIEHYIYKEKDFDINKNVEYPNQNDNSSLVEIIKKLTITYYDTKRLDINLHISNIDNIDFIKENLDTLLFSSECVIFMIDITSQNSFTIISEIISDIYDHLKKSLEYGDIPLFFISNKVDLEQDREVSGFEVKELTDKYPNFQSFEISLKQMMKV